MAPLPFTHLILDCDGVLVDTERPSCESLRRAILEVTGFDIPHNFPEDYQPVFGMDVRNCVEYYNKRFEQAWDVDGVAAEVLTVKERHYMQLTAGGITAFDGARQLIVRAKELGLGVGVASSGAPEKIRRNLESTGLIEVLDWEFVASASYVARGKPAPDVYLEAMRRLGCREGDRVLVVEDAVHGLVAAKAAGAFAVGVTNSLPQGMLEPHADHVVACLQDLLPLLDKGAVEAALAGDGSAKQS